MSHHELTCHSQEGTVMADAFNFDVGSMIRETLVLEKKYFYSLDKLTKKY